MKIVERVGLALVLFSILTYLFFLTFGFGDMDWYEKAFICILLYGAGNVGVGIFAVGVIGEIKDS